MVESIKIYVRKTKKLKGAWKKHGNVSLVLFKNTRARRNDAIWRPLAYYRHCPATQSDDLFFHTHPDYILFTKQTLPPTG
jgi:hypothetical protein